MGEFATDSQLIVEYDNYYLADPEKWAVQARNRYMVERVNDIGCKPKNVLDVGCGNGHTLAYAGLRWGVELHGLDLSPEAVRLAQKRLPEAVVSNEFLERWKPGRKYDLVLCMGVAEHFRDIVSGLKKLKELAGGYIYLEVPNCLSYSPGEQGYRRLSVGSHQLEWHLTKERWIAYINEAGLKIAMTATGQKRSWEFVWILE